MAINANHILPIAIGIAVVIAGTVIAKYLFSKPKNRRKSAPTKDAQPNESQPTSVKKTLLDPNEKYLLPLIEKEEISHDTRRFRFGLPTNDHILGLPIGQHIHLIATINDELVIRAYTPVSSDENTGYVDLVIKVYQRNVHPKFPDGGKMSQFVDALNIGETIAFRGPTGKLQYTGPGKFAIKKLRKDPPVLVQTEIVNMIAGGTGITPMLQLTREILKRPGDTTKLALLFANQSEDDILLRNELEGIAKQHGDRFKLWYTLDRTTEGWTYSKGFVSAEMIKEHLYPPATNTIVLMCGPPPMINYACLPHLDALGYNADLRFAY